MSEQLYALVYQTHISATPLIEFVRDFERRLPAIGVGLDESTPADRLCVQIIRSCMHGLREGVGTKTTLPEDVVKTVAFLQTKELEKPREQ